MCACVLQSCGVRFFATIKKFPAVLKKRNLKMDTKRNAEKNLDIYSKKKFYNYLILKNKLTINLKENILYNGLCK